MTDARQATYATLRFLPAKGASPMPGEEAAVHIPAGDVQGDKAWSRQSLSPEERVMPLPDACIAELDEGAALVRATSGPLEEVAPEAFSREGCADVIARGRTNRQHHS